MRKRRILSVIGSALIIIGTVLPTIKLPDWGTFSLLTFSKNESILLVILVFISLIFTFKRHYSILCTSSILLMIVLLMANFKVIKIWFSMRATYPISAIGIPWGVIFSILGFISLAVFITYEMRKRKYIKLL